MPSPTKRRRAEAPAPAKVEDEVAVADVHEKALGTLVTMTTVFLFWVSETARRVSVGTGGVQMSVFNMVVTDGVAFLQVVLGRDLAAQLSRCLKFLHQAAQSAEGAVSAD